MPSYIASERTTLRRQERLQVFQKLASTRDSARAHTHTHTHEHTNILPSSAPWMLQLFASSSSTPTAQRSSLSSLLLGEARNNTRIPLLSQTLPCMSLRRHSDSLPLKACRHPLHLVRHLRQRQCCGGIRRCS